MHDPLDAARPAVAIYRKTLLPLSETFIDDHIRLLQRWRPVPVYARLVERGSELAPFAPLPLYPAGETGLARGLVQRLGVAPALARALRGRGARLLHAHFLYDGAAIARFAARQRLKLIVTAHGYDATIYPRYQRCSWDGLILLRNERVLRRSAAMFVCVSEFIRGELLARGYPAEKLVVNPLGILPEQYPPGAPAGQRSGVLFAGRLVEKKGVALLLRAWALLPEALRRQPLTVIGGGELSAALPQLAGELGITAEFRGPQPRAVLAEAMRTHRVFAFPSLRAANGDAEGMGLVAMEAQAVGTPVLAFDEGPAREVLSPGHHETLARPGDAADLARQLQRLLEDDALADRLGAEGPDWVARRFDLRRSMERLEALYDRVAAGAPKRG